MNRPKNAKVCLIFYHFCIKILQKPQKTQKKEVFIDLRVYSPQSLVEIYNIYKNIYLGVRERERETERQRDREIKKKRERERREREREEREREYRS